MVFRPQYWPPPRGRRIRESLGSNVSEMIIVDSKMSKNLVILGTSRPDPYQSLCFLYLRLSTLRKRERLVTNVIERQVIEKLFILNSQNPGEN